MGAAVGIGMGGGLKEPKVVMSGFILAASFSVLCVGAGVCLRVRYGKRSDANKTSAQQGKEKHMNKLPSHQVREHILTQGEDPTTSSHSGICTTVDVTADCGDSFWIQLHRGMINFEHQDIPEKDDVLGTIIDAFPVPDAADLEPGNSMTFEISTFSSGQLDQLIDRLVQEYFVATSPDAITCRSERL